MSHRAGLPPLLPLDLQVTAAAPVLTPKQPHLHPEWFRIALAILVPSCADTLGIADLNTCNKASPAARMHTPPTGALPEKLDAAFRCKGNDEEVLDHTAACVQVAALKCCDEHLNCIRGRC